MKVDKKSISNMSNRLDRIEEEIGLAPFSSEQEQEQILLEQALEQARRRLATNATAATTDLFEEFALRSMLVLKFWIK